MSDSSRPSIQSVQRSLIIGIVVGIILGCAVGAGLVGFYIRQNPPVYQGGAYPNEMTNAYQNHYLAMAVDSYIVTQQPEIAQERLKTFDEPTKIAILAERSAAFVAAGRGAEAQFINNLAMTLKEAEGWNDDTIRAVVADLAVQYQNEPAKAQAIGAFSAQLLNGQVPALPQGEGQPEQPPPAEGEQPPAVPPPAEGEQPPAPEAAPPAPAESGGILGALSPLRLLLCCLVLIIVIAIIYFIGRRRFEARRGPTKQQIVWEGEGTPPIKQWRGTYNLGDDNYDEFFTIETDEGDFLGESGMGIMDAIPNTTPKQVVSFDVGLFDKTDITTLSRVIMSQFAYNDETYRMKVDANPQAEAVLAEPGKEFTFETSAMRITAKIEELAYGDEENKYFEKLTVSMDLFLKEGADLRKGEMDIPEQYQ